MGSKGIRYLHSDGSHAGPAPTVGDAEGLVEVEVGDVGPVVARPAETHLGVHVGPVQVHLATLIVHQRGDFSEK